MIQLKELKTKAELKKFVEFPFKLYKKNPYWVPPIIKDELASFNPKENPVFKHAKARYFVAEKNNRIVGRIAAIINYTEVNEQKIKKMRFGWCDFIDNDEVSTALFNKVASIGEENNLSFMEGPVGFSNMDKVGVLTQGFDHIGTMITWYNFSYYKDHYKNYGFNVEKEYVENKFPFLNAHPKFFMKASGLVKRRYNVKALCFTKPEEIFPYVDEMFDLFNKSYASLESFVPISNEQKEYFKEKYISFINPEYIKFVLDKDDKLIGFGITMPSFSEALQKANGKLFPFGFYHLLKAKKHSKDIIFYLIGVAPEYQNKGITAVIFEEYYKTFKEKGIEYCYRTPELKTNTAIAALWKNFDPQIYKQRCTFRKDL
ncbi:MAG TPA: GNAT family N-acetyltransferase [Flavobacteriaceae bacterium]|nr:GNAT family N-acetyltransferase [Flavobacteriaceae bacterium]